MPVNVYGLHAEPAEIEQHFVDATELPELNNCVVTPRGGTRRVFEDEQSSRFVLSGNKLGREFQVLHCVRKPCRDLTFVHLAIIG